ncbi:MAG TPA: TIGR01777 family oxidoreductase [Anaerolineales bacterium]|nr:TIGR01777 family oxidoreductase [Anaerolineales bacterium]HRQ91617.1 TIGR01777 family oxidoreductase [Anaerolineales bacterium]
MNVLITGGSGLIGRRLAASLATEGHQVTILSRNPERISGLPAGVQAAAWDGRGAAGWQAHADAADAIVNLAGASIKGEGFLPSRWTPKRKQLILESRVQAGQAVMEALRAAPAKPRTLLQASAVGYYGPHGSEPVAEDAPAGADFLAGVCQQWEASTQEAESLGVRRVVLRTGLPLTLEGGAFPLLVLPFRLFAGGWFGNGQQYYPWIHIEDYIAALHFLLTTERTKGIFNISAPYPQPNREFAATLGRVMRRPSWLPAPRFALELALGEVSTVVLDGQRAVPMRLLQSGFNFTYPELGPALQDLLERH